MSNTVIIDGNNLLHAMHQHAPIPQLGRETLVRLLDRWARRGNDEVTLVFDGARPPGGLGRQFSSNRIDVRFSAPETADDVIIRLVERVRYADLVRVVTSDTAIRHATVYRRCKCTDTRTFILEICGPSGGRDHRADELASTTEKPTNVSREEMQEWLDLFNDEPNDK